MGARRRVIVTRRLPAPVEDRLRARFDVRLNESDRAMDEAALAKAMREADALLCTVTDQVSAAVLSVPERRACIVANFGAGTNHIDLATARALGIVVTNTPDVLTEDTADLTLLLLLAAARRASDAERELRAGVWTGWRPTHALGMSPRGKSLGIIGFGRIGRAVAQRAAQALGMHVRYVSRSPAAPSPYAEPCASVDALLAESDIVSLHAPSTPETRHLIDARRLSLMPRHAILINTSRGDLVDERALVTALREGTIAGAGLDVYEHEPSVSPELLALPGVVLLPHIGSATHETREAMGDRALGNLDAFFASRTPPDRVA